MIQSVAELSQLSSYAQLAIVMVAHHLLPCRGVYATSAVMQRVISVILTV
jgi:hypothetical protein